MIQETIAGELRALRPDDPGNWLTNGETFSQLVILGKEDSPDNWHETVAGPQADNDVTEVLKVALGGA